MLPTPVPPSPSELATPKVLFKGRLVSGKKSNSPYFVHQRHKSKTQQELAQQQQQQEQQQQQNLILDQHNTSLVDQKLHEIDRLQHQRIRSNGSSSSSSTSTSAFLRKLYSLSALGLQYSFFVLLLSILLSRMITEKWFWGYESKYTRWSYYFPGPQETFTVESLSYHDGIKDPTKPLLLSIDGLVYDVSSNSNMYGPNGGAYHHFIGRDASRAFLTGCFKSGLTHDLRGLTDRQKKSLEYWKNFFENSPRYPRVGRLILPKLEEDAPIPKDCEDPKAEGGAI